MASRSPIEAAAADLAAGTRAIAELVDVFADAGRQRARDLEAWRAWDRQAPALAHAAIEHP